MLKIAFVFSENDSLLFLLWPVNALLGIVSGAESIYQPKGGYYFETLNIIIDKSCSGFNFWLLCIVAFGFLFLKYCGNHLSKAISIVFVIILAYGFTIFVNTSRIYISLIVHQKIFKIFPGGQALIHEAVGIITNLTFLILMVYFLERFFVHKQLRYAKSS